MGVRLSLVLVVVGSVVRWLGRGAPGGVDPVMAGLVVMTIGLIGLITAAVSRVGAQAELEASEWDPPATTPLAAPVRVSAHHRRAA